MSVHTQLLRHEARGHHEAIVAAVQTWSTYQTLGILSPALLVVGRKVVQAVRVVVAAVREARP